MDAGPGLRLAGARILGRIGIREFHAERLDPSPIHVPDDKRRASGDHAVSHHRHASERTEHVAADRRVVLFRNGELVASVRIHVRYMEAG